MSFLYRLEDIGACMESYREIIINTSVASEELFNVSTGTKELIESSNRLNTNQLVLGQKWARTFKWARTLASASFVVRITLGPGQSSRSGKGDLALTTL